MSADLSRHLSLLRRRASIVAAIRAFFDRRGYLAVETPQLCRTPIPEAHIELFETRRDHPALGTTEPLWLLPSPEYYLKRLLAAGAGSLYEITHSFRNGEEISRVHDIEFTMLEYYTVDANSEDSLTITRELLQELGESAAPLVLPMQEAWRRFTGIDLAATLPSGRATPGPGAGIPGGSTPSASRAAPPKSTESPAPPDSPDSAAPDRQALEAAIQRANLSLSISPEDSWEDLFQRVFLTYIEPDLPQDRPVFITNYPAAVSTLARTTQGTPWADRWELYLGGVEVANCFGEETNPRRIAAFFAEQNAEKAAVGHRVHPVQQDYLHSPELPRCSGVAMGIDRLVMHLVGATALHEVVSFRP